MSIESTLERIATALEALAASRDTGAKLVIDNSVGTDVPAVAKRGPGRPPKATTAQAESVPNTTPAAAVPESAASAPAGSATKEQTQNALVALIKANKRDTVVKILGEHGAQSVSALAPEHYAAVYAKALAATPAA